MTQQYFDKFPKFECQKFYVSNQLILTNELWRKTKQLLEFKIFDVTMQNLKSTYKKLIPNKDESSLYY